MLLTYRRDERLAAADWRLLEFTSTQNSDIIARRIARKIPEIFGRHAVEVFLCSAFMSQGWIFVRSLQEDLLRKMKSVHGLSVDRDTRVEHSYVAELLSRARAEYLSRMKGITVGSFVRIRDGLTRDYCGTIESLAGGIATVAITGFATRFHVKTPVCNLEDLSRVPQSQRTFYSAAKGESYSAAETKSATKYHSHQKPQMARRPAGRQKVRQLPTRPGRYGRRGASERAGLQRVFR